MDRSPILAAAFLLLLFGNMHATPKDAEPHAVRWSTKRVAFDLNGKPWREVLEWFAARAQMPLGVSRYGLPAGKFSVEKSPNQKGEVTLLEIFDILNTRLQAKGFTLIRGETALRVVPVEGSALALWQRVRIEDLKERGRTEVVEILLDLPARLNAEEFAPQMKRLLGSFGRLVPLPDNRLLVIGDVATLQRTLDILADHLLPPTPAAAMPASPLPPPAACCESSRHCRGGLLGRLLRR